MPVIINDLEVVIETPTPAVQKGGAADNDSASQRPVELMPYDLSVLQRQQRNRADRVKAH